MEAANFVRDCLPDPPTPINRAWPPEIRNTRLIRLKCVSTYLFNKKIIISYFSSLRDYYNVLEKDEIQSGFIRIIIVCDVTHNDRIEPRHVGNLLVSSVFLKQVWHSIISKH